jgi:hypothetical protein
MKSLVEQKPFNCLSFKHLRTLGDGMRMDKRWSGPSSDHEGRKGTTDCSPAVATSAASQEPLG